MISTGLHLKLMAPLTLTSKKIKGPAPNCKVQKRLALELNIVKKCIFHIIKVEGMLVKYPHM